MFHFISKLNRSTHYAFSALAGIMILGFLFVSSRGPQTTVRGFSNEGVVNITGKVKVTNPFALENTAEPFMALIDMTAFIKRDLDMNLPYANQLITGLQGDVARGATFTMSLPIEPAAALNNVGHDAAKGVAVFAVDFDTNSIGDSFLGPYEWRGWPGGSDSLLFDPGTYEVSAGELLVWSPDDQQMFPAGFGADGKLFTADDPVAPVAKGWTVVNLNKTPFEYIREHTVDIPIIEGLSANNDLSRLSYTQAFDALVKDLKVRYAFTQHKHIDWTAIDNKIRPQVEKAEQQKDRQAFNVALMYFAAAFKDGHIQVNLDLRYRVSQTECGLGMVLGQTDDGVVIARLVLEQMPAAQAGIKPGARILEWNGQPIEQALDNTELLFAPQSSPQATRLQQLRYIGRAPAGTRFTIKYQNPGEDTQTVALTTTTDYSKGLSLSLPAPTIKRDEMPIQVSTLPSGIGYIKINTFAGDRVMLVRTWEWALKKMKELPASALIIDIRQNGGGWGPLATYFAGSFTTDTFVLDERFRADKTGAFVYAGKDIIKPAPVQWDKPVAVLVGPACASACEMFAAAMAHNPHTLIVGSYPTAGIEAGVAPWTLPDGLYFQAPIDQMRTPDGNIFVEGTGVVPNVKIPVTVDSLLSSQDQSIPVAEKALNPLIEQAISSMNAAAVAPTLPTAAATQAP